MTEYPVQKPRRKSIAGSAGVNHWGGNSFDQVIFPKATGGRGLFRGFPSQKRYYSEFLEPY